MKNLLGKILFIANSNPGALACKSYFYPVKYKLLKLYGDRISTDVQYIKKSCYKCSNGRYIEIWGNSGKVIKNVECFYCHGSGIYQEFTAFLDKYKLGKNYFHIPVKKIDGDHRWMIDKLGNIIEGHIKHKKVNKKHSIEAILWLWLLYDRKRLKYFFDNLNLYSHNFKKSFYPLSFIFWMSGICNRFKMFLNAWLELSNEINDYCPEESEPKKVGYWLGLELSLGIWYDFYPQSIYRKIVNKFRYSKPVNKVLQFDSDDILPF